MLHTLWGKAHDHPDYDKREWVFLQAQFETLLLAAERARDAFRETSRAAKDYTKELDDLNSAIKLAKKEQP